MDGRNISLKSSDEPCDPDDDFTFTNSTTVRAFSNKKDDTEEKSPVKTTDQANSTLLPGNKRPRKDSDDSYLCNYCGKVFAVPARHYRTHTGEKPYGCEFCDKSFALKENLSVHRRIHTKERPYKCELCDSAFEHSGKLRRHKRTHTGDRPHKCLNCNKTFIQKGQLAIHKRTHTGEKPFVCKDCGKGFTCLKQLKVHHRTHSGEKPYSCNICGKLFGHNHTLKHHLVAHYAKKLYKCTICSDTFSSKKGLETHTKTHPKNNQKETTLNERQPQIDSHDLSDSIVLVRDPVESIQRAFGLETGENSPLARRSSNPVSSVSSTSTSGCEIEPTLNLPPRKRSKAIFESLESTTDKTTVVTASTIDPSSPTCLRSSVIH